MTSFNIIIGLLLGLIIISCSDQRPLNESIKSVSKVETQDEWNDRVEKGKTLFATNCEKCHTAPHRIVRDGTSWTGLFERVPDGEKYILEFFCSSSTMRNDSDLYAIKIKEEFGSTDYEHEFSSSLSKEELKNLMVYLKEEIEKRQ